MKIKIIQKVIYILLLFLICSVQTVYSASVIESQIKYSDLPMNQVSNVKDLDLVQQMFNRILDARLWTWNEMPNFPRRLPWVVPSDGCYLRAEWMAEKFQEWGYPKVKQIFIFGDLTYSAVYEEMSWWYHVAPVVRVGVDVYVLDPSLDYRKPLIIREWAQKMGTTVDDALFALCEPGAVSPDDDCSSVTSLWDPAEKAETLQRYLDIEWKLLEQTLGEKTAQVLGDAPPWR